MEASRCHLCQRSCAKFTCLCTYPASQACSNCIARHLESEGTHLPSPITKASRKAASISQNEVCDICGANAATWFCFCGKPIQKFCDGCDMQHYQKAMKKTHYKHPISAYLMIISSRMPLECFKKREKFIDKVHLRLNENVLHFDEFAKKVALEFDKLIQLCIEKKEKLLRELEIQRTKLIHALGIADQVIAARRYQDMYKPNTWLEALLLDGYNTNPDPAMILHTGIIDFSNVEAFFAESVKNSLSIDLVTKSVNDCLPVLYGGRCFLYEVTDLKKKEIPYFTNLPSYGEIAYCFIDSYILLCCGGQSRVTMTVNLQTKAMKDLSSMIVTRINPGLLKFRNNFVYAFGGCKSEYEKTAEKYSIEANKWTMVTGQLIKAKWNCSACEHCTGIYISGIDEIGGYIELFDLQSEMFRLLFIYQNIFEAIIFCDDENLYWISHETTDTIKISTDCSAMSVTKSKTQGLLYEKWVPVCPMNNENQCFVAIALYRPSSAHVFKFDPATEKFTLVSVGY